MKLIYPLELPVITTRGFFFADSVYWGGVHLAEDIVRMWATTHLANVIAPGDGEAMAVPLYDRYRGYYVIFRLPGGWRMHVAHLASFAIPIGVWVPVKQRQVVGYADNTGASLGDHAHVDFINDAPRSSEAVPKPPLGGWAHALSKWINVDLGWPATTQEDVDVKVVRSPDGLCVTLGATGRRWIATTEELNGYVAVFGPIVNISQSQMNAIPWDLGNNDVWHILFDYGVAAPDDGRRMMRMSYTLEQNNRMLFDPTPVVDPNDKRRMIDTRNMVKAIRDKVGA